MERGGGESPEKEPEMILELDKKSRKRRLFGVGC